jgi:hypothetical protein
MPLAPGGDSYKFFRNVRDYGAKVRGRKRHCQVENVADFGLIDREMARTMTQMQSIEPPRRAIDAVRVALELRL